MTLAVLTPTYTPDLESFELLHRSLLECTDPDVIHHAVVPDEDIPLFAPLRSDRLILTGYRAILPRSFVSTAWFGRAVAHIPGLPRGARFIAVNRRRPLPPLRGWILQQIVKLSAARRLDADVLVMADSDMQLIAPLDEAMFRTGDSVRYYRMPGAITPDMSRHVRWHRTARRLLGAPPDSAPPYDDPIAGLLAWDPRVVRGCTDRIAQVAGRDWETALSGEWEFSEYVIYGQYLREFGTDAQRAIVSDRTLCHNWWGPDPIDEMTARAFIASVSPDDLAMRIQSTTATPLALRVHVQSELARRSRSAR